MKEQQIYVPLAIAVIDIQMEKGYAGSKGTTTTPDLETGGNW